LGILRRPVGGLNETPIGSQSRLVERVRLIAKKTAEGATNRSPRRVGQPQGGPAEKVTKPRGAGAPRGETPDLLQVETLQRTLPVALVASGGQAHERRRREAGAAAGGGRAPEGQRPGGYRPPNGLHRPPTERIPGGSKPLKPIGLASPSRAHAGLDNGKRGRGLERGSALREGKTLKVESQERYRDEISPERCREAKAGESVRNAGAGPWRARNARVKRIPDSVSAVGKSKPRKVVGPRRALPLPGVKSQRVTGSEIRAQPAASAAGQGAPVDGWFRMHALEGRARLREERHVGPVMAPRKRP